MEGLDRLRIMVADELPDPVERIAHVKALGHHVVSRACGLAEAVEAARKQPRRSPWSDYTWIANMLSR
jgi:hypothetical protein